MRLVDADAFEKFIRDKYEDGESTDDIKDQMLFDLSYQPTAYDIEKVVAELEENKQSEINFRDIVGRDMEKPSHTFSRTIGRIEAFGHAIEIVKAGGAE